MKPLRVIASTCILIFLVASPASSLAQTDGTENTSIPKTHRYQPTMPAEAGSSSPTASPKSGELSDSVKQQINALMEEKQSRTPAQKKISSRLLYTARMLQGRPAATGVPVLRSGLEVDDQNNLLVDITATVSDQLLERLRSNGVRVLQYTAAHRFIRALVPPANLETIAAFSEITFISPRREYRTRGNARLPYPLGFAPSNGFRERAANVRKKLAGVLAGQPGVAPTCAGQGSAVSEGLKTHQASDACTTFGVTGAGVKIGVLSDGVTSLATSQGTGDLGPVTVLPGQTGSGDEGTAMLEIIHDLAPDATLYFATADPDNDQFAQNILDLRAAGCDIIVDDIIYFIESPFQDGQGPGVISEFDGGIVSQAVNDVVADGAMYFSAAGNEGNKDDVSFGFTGTYEGDFVDGGTNGLIPGGKVHKFGPGTTAYDPVTAGGGDFIWLYWADPLGGSTNDYDFYVLNSAGNQIVDGSNDNQDGTQDPTEGFGATIFLNERAVVVQNTGAANRFFHIIAFSAELAVNTPGAIFGHAGASGAFAVAATPADLPFNTGFPTGPFPNPFSSINVVEPFSSDGPRHIFFEADGTPITPGNFSSTGGTILPKPAFTAADGVSVSGVDFFTPFYGTSAAAPHAAAIAGLIKSFDNTLTNSDVTGFMTSSAIDIMGAGTDRDSGAGIIMALAAVQAADKPRIISLSPTSGNVGTIVTITGKNFGATTDTVTFNGTAATPSTWSDASISVPVPAGATTGNVVVTVGGVASNGVLFTLVPHITTVAPNSGTVGLPVTITGANFGTTQGASTVTFNGTTATPANWGPTSIVVPVPLGVSTGNVVVTVNGVASNGVLFTFLPPAITSLSTNEAPIGTAVTITGTNFGTTQGTSTVKFNGQVATATWSDTSIATTVPGGATSGNVVVTVNNANSNGSAFIVQDFAFAAALTDITLTAGGSQTENFTVNTPDGFTAAITFSCTGLPDKSSCTFTPPSVTPGANTTSPVTLQVSTTAAVTNGIGMSMLGTWVAFGGFGLVLAGGAGSRKRNRKALAGVALCLTIPLVLAITSCGGGGSSHTTTPGTPPGTYTVTVRATAGADSHSSTFTLKVN